MFKNKKNYVLGKDVLDNNVKSILKTKGITTEQKCSEIIEEYNLYFSDNFIADVKYITNIVLNKYNDNTENKTIYNKNYRYEFENLLFYHIATQAIEIHKLMEQGLDINKMSEDNKTLVNDAMSLYNNIIKVNFDGKKFYSNKTYRKTLLNELVSFADKHYKSEMKSYKEQESQSLVF